MNETQTSCASNEWAAPIERRPPSSSRWLIVAAIAVAIIAMTALIGYYSGGDIINKIVEFGNLATSKMATLYLNNQLLINTIFYSTLGVFAGSAGIGGAIYAGYELSELKGKKQTPVLIDNGEKEEEEKESYEPVNELYSPDSNSITPKSRVEARDKIVGVNIADFIPERPEDCEDD